MSQMENAADDDDDDRTAVAMKTIAKCSNKIKATFDSLRFPSHTIRI